MEHAGQAVAQAIEARAPNRGTRIVSLIGRGHNGGDGLSASRLLATAGYEVAVYMLGERSVLRDEPALYAQMVERLGVPRHDVVNEPAWQALEAAVRRADWVIDALLGLGFQGSLRPEVERAIRLLKHLARAVLAVDIPSGLNADTGIPQPVAVRATLTVTFGWPKLGFFVNDGPQHVGEVIVSPMTYPPQLLAKAVPA